MKVHRWHNPATGASGASDPLPAITAEAIVAEAVALLPELDHWIEDAPRA